jgi:Predicted secreted protein
LKPSKTVAISDIFLKALHIASGTFATYHKRRLKNQIRVKVNERFTIQLDSDPSTGYKWISSYSSEFLYLISSQYTNSRYITTGIPKTQLFKFKALKSGKIDILMQYKRSWDDQIISCENPIFLPDRWCLYHVIITE